MDRVDAVVIGAGVVGLAVARALVQACTVPAASSARRARSNRPATGAIVFAAARAESTPTRCRRSGLRAWHRVGREKLLPLPDDIDDDVRELVERVREATAALMQGDVRRYLALVNEAPDYTLMPPHGGPTRHGVDHSPETLEATEAFFPGGGDGDLDLEQVYASNDLVVLVGVERQHGPIGGLPAQEWPLRVTLVFRREDAEWRLVHRHADALVHTISMEHLSRLALGTAESV